MRTVLPLAWALNEEKTLYICKVIKQQPSPALRLVYLGHFISQLENILIIRGNPGVRKGNFHGFLANPAPADKHQKQSSSRAFSRDQGVVFTQPGWMQLQ